MKSIKSCCATPAITFDAFKDQCSNYMNKGPQTTLCLYECIFNATNTLSGTSLNINNARTMLSKIFGDNQDFVNAYAQGMQNCTSSVQEMASAAKQRPPPPTMMLGGQNCSPVPLMYTSWTNSNDCNEAKEYVQNCKNQNKGAGGLLGPRKIRG
ncbi:uncharacterized protein LOC115634740 [Scaptodrosophila lebanonensis]|uniref:Uncharacterized protein LOC115634740 n=1 Tax=Drosophila lebanonensis TaxID=7225 RepID=A0A6J2UM51_DROLE|nr:uncharacterized protein LOC115634740 [Scaptodrosophila lebanonensis]